MSRILIMLAVLLVAAVVLSDTPKPAGPAAASAPATGAGSVITLGQSPADEAENQAVRQKLLRRLEKVEIVDARLEDVIQAFREQTGLNFHVKWGVLRMVEIGKDTPVSLLIDGEPTGEEVLELVLDKVEGVNLLAYTVDKGVITITAMDDLARKTVLRSYDVTDLILSPPLSTDEKALLISAVERLNKDRKAARQVTTCPAASGPAAGMVLPSLFDVCEGKAEAVISAVQAGIYRQRETDLLELLRQTIDSSSWRETEGNVGTARMWHSNRLSGQGQIRLIIEQTSENHRQIERLLNAVRGRAETSAEVSAEKPNGKIVLKGVAQAQARPAPKADQRPHHLSMSAAPTVALGQNPSDNARNSAASRMLRRRLERVEIEGAAFDKVIQAFADQTQLSYLIEWHALESVGVDGNTPITLRLKEPTAQRALELILEEAGGVNPIGYVLENGRLQISTRDDLAKKGVIRVYDVSDLTAPGSMSPHEKAVLMLAMENLLTEPIRDPTSYSGCLVVPSWMEAYENQAGAVADGISSFVGRGRSFDLLEMLRSQIDPACWRDYQEVIASARMWSSGRLPWQGQDKLIVLQTWENHRKIEELLDGLRGRAATATSMPAEKPSGSIVLKGAASRPAGDR